MSSLLNQKKYEATIAYLCQKVGGKIHGKKKLAKLLYFADFDFYEKNQKSITGDIYKALPMGPFPVALEEVTAAMAKHKILTIEQTGGKNGYHPTETYCCTTSIESKALTVEEKKMLDRIVLKYGHLNGTQLEELSHAEAPYIGTELKNEIPYELAFYRGTDFSDL
jgi:uncharacterized phage-associated protein